MRLTKEQAQMLREINNGTLNSQRNGSKPKNKNANSSRKQKRNRRVNLNNNFISSPSRMVAPINSVSDQLTRPAQITSKGRTCRVVHRELIDSYSGTSAFTVAAAIAVNPGITGSFPWLSVIAQNWEKYRFRKLRFCYYTRTSTLTVGSIMLIPEYDPADDPPGSEQIASSYEGTQSSAPWKDFSCSLDPKEMHDSTNYKFVRTGPLPANQDIKTYDAATFYVATLDGVDGNSWGKLWVEYDVDFENPQLPPHGPIVFGGRFVGGTLCTADEPLGEAIQVNANNLGVELAITGARSDFRIQNPGYYMVGLDVNGTGVTATSLTGLTPLGVEIAVTQETRDGDFFGVTTNYRVRVKQANQVLRFACTALTVTQGSVDIAMAPFASLD